MPEAAIAAPVAAPSKPSPTAAPAPAKPAFTPPPDKPQSDYMADIGADLDTLSEESDASAEGRKPNEKRVEKPAAPATKPESDKPPVKEGEKPPEGEKPAAEPDEPAKIGDLRTAYRSLKKKFKEDYEPKLQQLQTLEAKVKELETTNPPEVKAMQERLAAAEKRRDALEAEINFVNFKEGTKYKETYEKPFIQGWTEALNDFVQLTVEDGEGNVVDLSTLPRETALQRAADLLTEISNLPLGKARARARALFGDSVEDVMAHRRKVIELSNAQTKALEDAKTTGVERARTMDTERKANTERTIKQWAETNTAIVTKWPKMFGQVEGDTEGNQLLTKGEAMADKLFSPTAETAPKTPEEAIQLHALIKQKVRNHDRLALWLKKANGKIKELETSLSQYEKSDPNGGLNGGGGGAGGEKTFLEDVDAEIDELAKKG